MAPPRERVERMLAGGDRRRRVLVRSGVQSRRSLDLDPLRDTPHRRQRTDPSVSTAPSAPWPGLSLERDDRRASQFAHRSTSAGWPGEISMSTVCHPGRYTYCIGEKRKRAHWPPYDAGEFLRPAWRPSGYSSGEAPHGLSYHASRDLRRHPYESCATAVSRALSRRKPRRGHERPVRRE